MGMIPGADFRVDSTGCEARFNRDLIAFRQIKILSERANLAREDGNNNMR